MEERPDGASSPAATSSSYEAMPGSHWIIDDFLAAGTFASAACMPAGRARRRAALLERGITHVVNCARELPCALRADGVAYLHLLASDVDGENMLALWPSACAFIERARAAGGRVLVHCAGGHSRSGSTVCAYLMARFGLDADAALARARARRPAVQPIPGFEEQLRRWGERCCREDGAVVVDDTLPICTADSPCKLCAPDIERQKAATAPLRTETGPCES